MMLDVLALRLLPRGARPRKAGLGLLGKAAATIALAGCGAGEGTDHHFMLEDSAGVAVATTSGAGAWGADEGWQVAAEPWLILGDGPGEELWQVRGYVRTRGGDVAVLSAGHGQVRVFDSTGALVRSFGREGAGPGELLRPMSIALAPPGTLLVLDQDAIEVFRLDGTWIGSHPVGPVAGTFGVGTAVRPLAVGPTSAMPAVVIRRRPEAGPPVGVYRPEEGMAVFPSPEQPPVLLGWYGGIEQERIDLGGGRTRSIVSPFARSTMAGVGPDGSVFVADTERYEIRVWDSRGRLQRIIRRDVEPVAVRPTWVEDWKEAQRRMDWTQGQLPELERGWARMTVRETLPAFEAVHADRRGYWWVLRPTPGEEDGSRFDVFDPEGRYLGRVTAPVDVLPRPEMMLIGDDHFSAVHLDELNVETVRFHRLTGRG